MTNHDNSSDDDINEPMMLEMAPIDLRLLKKPSAPFSAPIEFLVPAGRLVLSWSGVEQSMDRLIARMLTVVGQSEPGWERLNFKKTEETLSRFGPSFIPEKSISRILRFEYHR